jgi:steroid 5-alpha reductase family enzyme
MQPIAVIAVVSIVAMAGVWYVQWRTGNAGYVDVAWSYLMVFAALVYALTGGGAPLARITMALLAGLWGLRLGTHLLLRVSREPEDGRYRYLRETIAGHQGKFFAFFMLQAGLTVLFSLPFWVVAQNPTAALTPWYVLGVAIWIAAIVGEAVADRQLARFRGEPRNKGNVCQVGLWRYSRHPNYFFEWLHWFSYVALSVGAAHAWLSLLGALLMLVSLCWVTGIPFVEAQALRSRGDAYRAYQRTTSAFVPWPRRREA